MIREGSVVRLLNDVIEGIVISFRSPQQVELEDSYGFRRIVSLRELVEVVAVQDEVAHETAVSSSISTTESVQTPIKDTTRSGVHDEEAVLVELSGAASPTSPDRFILDLVNASSWNLLFEGGIFSGEKHVSGFHGDLAALSRLRLGEFSGRDVEASDGFYFQMIFFSDQYRDNRPPQYRQLRLTQKDIQAVHSGEQFVRKSLLSLGSEAARIGRLLDKFSEKNSNIPEVTGKGKSTRDASRAPFNVPKEKVVDLHIEKLVKDFHSMSPAQIIALQLSVFEKELDNALLTGVTSLVMIHGIGSGVLRSSIREELKKYDGIRYSDAPAEKYGRGATQILIK